MADDKFREKILAATENPLVQMFKEQYDEKLRDSEQMSKFSPPINKVGKLLRPSIIPIIGQPQSLDFLEIMNKKKIVVCRFSKGRLGEEIAQILGSLIVSMVLCDGSSYSTSTYPSLFALIGYTYGGSTSTFGVPNLGGRTIFGPSANESTTIGATGGATSTNVLSNVVGNNSGVSYSSGGAGCGGQGCPLLSVTNNTTTASIIPSYIILQYIIKF